MLVGVIVESTYNWYWLIDGLIDAEFFLHLANTTTIKQYDGLKHRGDKSDAGKTPTIEMHTKMVMDGVKGTIEAGGGTMDSILQLTVFLAKLDYYDGMNSVFKTYFPNGGPARTTVAVAGLPGESLVEINCIAAVVKKGA